MKMVKIALGDDTNADINENCVLALGDDLFSMGKTMPMPSKAKMAVPKKRGNLSVIYIYIYVYKEEWQLICDQLYSSWKSDSE